MALPAPRFWRVRLAPIQTMAYAQAPADTSKLPAPRGHLGRHHTGASGEQRNGALGQRQLPGAERARAGLPEGLRRGARAEIRLPAVHRRRPFEYDPYSMEVVQWPDRVLFRYEKDDQVADRVARWPQADDPRLRLQGFSVGRYEGDALIVDTDHFLFDITGFDDYNGIPSSPLKKVHERYWREGDRAEGDA